VAVKKSPAGRQANTGRKSPAKKKKTHSAKLAVVFWLLFIAVIAGIFIAKRETIKENYSILAKRFGLPVSELPVSPANEKQKPEAPTGEKPAITVTHAPRSVTPPGANKAPKNQPSTPPAQPATLPPPAKETAVQPAPNKPAANQTPANQNTANKPAVNQTPGNQPAANQTATNKPAANQTPANQPAAQTQAAPAVKAAETRERNIYFTQLDKDGDILRIRVPRAIKVSDSPMLDCLNSLLAGPTADEKRRGLLSLIPANTKILSATVRGNTAYISFSEDFQYNTYGVEGYAAQIRQVVWTATEFPNVNDVQILVEGKRIDYLGEGIWIGSPVSRDSL